MRRGARHPSPAPGGLAGYLPAAGELEPPTPHPPCARHTFQKLPDVIAMTWAVGVVGSYFLLCLTVYAAIISSTANHGSWDASVIHNEFSRRRYFLATLTPGMVRLVRVRVRVR